VTAVLLAYLEQQILHRRFEALLTVALNDCAVIETETRKNCRQALWAAAHMAVLQ
jgi:hypothetical protein